MRCDRGDVPYVGGSIPRMLVLLEVERKKIEAAIAALIEVARTESEQLGRELRFRDEVEEEHARYCMVPGLVVADARRWQKWRRAHPECLGGHPVVDETGRETGETQYEWATPEWMDAAADRLPDPEDARDE